MCLIHGLWHSDLTPLARFIGVLWFSNRELCCPLFIASITYIWITIYHHTDGFISNPATTTDFNAYTFDPTLERLWMLALTRAMLVRLNLST